MKRKLSRILSLPYPQASSVTGILLSSFLIALGVYLFLIIFQPFGTYNYSNPFKYFLLTPYALISFLIFSLISFCLKNRAGNWNVRKEILKITLTLAICAVLSYIYNINFINHTGFNLRSFVFMFLYTFALGIPVYLIHFFGRFAYAKQAVDVDILTPTIPAEEKTQKLLLIRPDAGVPLEIVQDDFLFAESESNYCTVFYLDNGILKKQLLRLPLKSLEEQIKAGKIIRCHRSYIVNTGKVTHMKGNAQGYKLSLAGSESTVPVSRNYIPLVREHLVIGNF